MALKGDFKGRKIGRLNAQADTTKRRMGLTTFEQVIALELDNDGTRY
jgi:hypothetical protein